MKRIILVGAILTSLLIGFFLMNLLTEHQFQSGRDTRSCIFMGRDAGYTQQEAETACK